MKETTLLKIAFLSTIIGILCLFLLADNIEIPITNLEDITEENLDKYVIVRGYVDSYKVLTGLSLIDIHDDTGSIQVIMFNEEEIKINQNSLLQIEGTVSEYKGQLQINAEDIKVLE